MRNMAHEAGYKALDEKAKGRITTILFPNKNWSPAIFEMGPAPDGIWVRMSDQHASLRTIAMDTLILVAANDAGWDTDGVKLALEKLRTSLHPKVIVMKRGVEDVIREGEDVWK